jgi:fatty-acyl-CoA synthase
MVNLSAFIDYHARRDGGSEAVLYAGERITYADLAARLRALAALFAARGVGQGDVVALLMKNSAAYLDIAFAASYLGAVFLPINYRLSREEVAYIVADSGTKLLCVDEELTASAGGTDAVLVFDVAAQRDPRVLGSGSPPPPVPRGPQDLMRLMYTSGTTAHPKGVTHSYGNFYWKNMDHALALGLSPHSRCNVVGPLYHVGGMDLPGLNVLWHGGLLCVHREFDPEATLEAIAAERLDCTWMAPVMTGRVLACEGRERYDVSSLRWCIGGGEKTPESRIRAFAEYFTQARYIDGYGLTETCGGDTLMEAGFELAKIGSTGRPTAHVELRIRDEQGADLPPGTSGEVCLRGPKVTAGYWNAPQKNAESFFPDGFFRTGDVGYVDQDGFLYLTDRRKDMIISGGENIASSEVERVIHELPQVAECAVIGVPDARWGERPIALVVPRDGARLDEETLRAHCRTRLAAFKVPDRFLLRTSLPRNPSGKVLKRVLREEIGGG